LIGIMVCKKERRKLQDNESGTLKLNFLFFITPCFSTTISGLLEYKIKAASQESETACCRSCNCF